MSATDLETLLTQSRAWNDAHGLTGLLLYSHGDIMQVLEGPEEEVRYIFARIFQDSRHSRVVKLSDGAIEDRNFSQWSMGFKILKTNDFAHLRSYVDLSSGTSFREATSKTDADLRAVLADFVLDAAVRY